MLTGMMSSIGAGATIQSGELDLTSGLDVEGAVTFNDSGADVNFRIESDDNANIFFVDGGEDRVGIGTATPQVLFEINKGATAAQGIDVATAIQTTGMFSADLGETSGNGIYNRVFFLSNSAGNIHLNFGDESDSDIGAVGYDNTDDSLFFRAGASEVMSVASGGLTLPVPLIATRPSVTNLADNGSILITATCANIDANGGARTGIRFAGTGTAGQILAVNNTGGEALTFHNTEGTALVRGIAADHDTMEANFMGLFISDGSLWNLIAGGVDSQPDVGLTAS